MKIILTLLATLLFHVSFAQSVEKEVEKVIYEIFNGMRAGDSARVASHFTPDATMKSISIKEDGSPSIQNGSLQGWLDAIGTPREEMLDERLWDVETRVDGNLAQVWTYYALYVGKKYHHCGVDAFQLFHDGDNWKVFHIADTRRADCDIPEQVKNK